jgi:hypothetical protein
MSNFKPEIRVITRETNRDYHNRQGKSAYVSIQYPTYKELKKNLLRHLQENLEPVVQVYRSRRGEWGEWFEHWHLVNGKPQIIKQGWM